MSEWVHWWISRSVGWLVGWSVGGVRLLLAPLSPAVCICCYCANVVVDLFVERLRCLLSSVGDVSGCIFVPTPSRLVAAVAAATFGGIDATSCVECMHVHGHVCMYHHN